MRKLPAVPKMGKVLFPPFYGRKAMKKPTPPKVGGRGACVQGQTAKNTGCTPESGEGGNVISKAVSGSKASLPKPPEHWQEYAVAPVLQKVPPGTKFELALLPVSSVAPSQEGEDYVNDSSRALAEDMKEVAKDGVDAINRSADYWPIVVDEGGKILDGNHRHAAHVLNGFPYVWAMVADAPASGKEGEKRPPSVKYEVNASGRKIEMSGDGGKAKVWQGAGDGAWRVKVGDGGAERMGSKEEAIERALEQIDSKHSRGVPPAKAPARAPKNQPTSNQLDEAEQRQARAKLDLLPKDKESDYARAYDLESVRVEDLGMVDDGWHPAPGQDPVSVDVNAEKYGRVMPVPLEGIGASQDAVSYAGLAAYVRETPDPKKEGWPEVALDARGKYHVLSGHTRLGAVSLSGRTHGVAIVYQYDENRNLVKKKPGRKTLSPFYGRKSLTYRVKSTEPTPPQVGSRGPCEQGQTAKNTGCTPESGEGGGGPAKGRKVSAIHKAVPGMLKKLFGMKSPEQMAPLTGAPDGAEIKVGQHVGAEGGLHVETNHPDYEYSQEQIFGKDAYGMLYMTLEYFGLKKEAQGTGLGMKVFGAQLDNCRKAGVRYMKLHAAKSESMNGYYTWPRFGFDQTFAELAKQDGGAHRDLVKKIREEFPGTDSVLDLMETKKGRDWWKANGVALKSARFNMTPGSQSMNLYTAYLKERESAKQA